MKQMAADKPYQYLGLAGALLWAGVVLIRQAGITLPGALLPLLLDVGPNVGALWLGMSLFVTCYPRIFGGPPRKLDKTLAVVAILALLLLSEIIHDRFLGAPFDWADMAASAVAALPLLALIALRPETGQTSPEDAGAEA